MKASRLSRDELAARIAADIPDGSYVNLGIGSPTAVANYLRVGFDEDGRAADLIQEYEATIAALERLVGNQALELEFLKGALRQ